MRAILLAAGMGTRLRPLTLTTPKSLIEVNGKSLLERQIEMLREKGVEEIIVLTGYLKESFDYLVEKYGVKLVHNDKYDVYNNIYTMYLVREYLSDSYVIDADIYINENFILENPQTSMYFCANKTGFENEWKVYFDENSTLTSIEVESGNGHILSGVSFWSKEDGKVIVQKLEKKIESNNFKELYWDDIVKENIDKLNIKVNTLKEDSVFEIDNLEELNEVKEKVEKLDIILNNRPIKKKKHLDFIYNNQIAYNLEISEKLYLDELACIRNDEEFLVDIASSEVYDIYINEKQVGYFTYLCEQKEFSIAIFDENKNKGFAKRAIKKFWEIKKDNLEAIIYKNNPNMNCMINILSALEFEKIYENIEYFIYKK